MKETDARREPEAREEPKKARKKSTKESVVELPTLPPMYYDTKRVETFLNLVFHGATDEVAVWIAKPGGAPGFPRMRGALQHFMANSHEAKALYFGTASLKPTTRHQIRNRFSQFSALHVVVLDDIGTKVPIGDLPEDLRRNPTYIIESSPGNYQYGYVLATPVTDGVLAKALVKLVYDSGLTDSGGAMPTKVVRLPDGVNGKPNENRGFPVKLVHMKGPLWEPSDLLHAIKSDVTWEQLEKNAEATLKSRKQVTTTMWGPTVNSPNLDGTVDPVLEWLYLENMVHSETDNWVQITCPWADEHSTETTAGYSPIGRGDDGFQNRRGFHCFHDACAKRKTPDFLREIAERGGPESSVVEEAAELVANWAFDPISNSAYQIHKGTRIAIQAFRNRFPAKVKVWHADGKQKLVPVVGVWLNAENRLSLDGGVRLDPTLPDRIVRDEEGQLCLNTYRPPPWGDGKYDEGEVEVFMEFLEYLLPDYQEREFFLDWIACKAQDMAFRGPAVLMVTPSQGTGRTTLADMLCTMLGEANSVSMPFSKLIGHGDFNEWQEKPFVVADETLNMAEDQSVYRAYEAFKDVVDFRPKRIRLNAKYDRARVAYTYSTYLLFSNHVDALRITSKDRRLVVLRNPDEPAPPEFFNNLNDWLAEGRWMKALWRWLRQRKVERDMTAPAMDTELKRDMVRASRSGAEIAMDILLSLWKGEYIATAPLLQVMEQVAPRLHIEPKHLPSLVRRHLNAVSYPTHMRVTAEGFGQLRPRLLKDRATPELLAVAKSESPSTVAIAKAGVGINSNDTQQLHKTLSERLTEEDL